MLRRLIGRAMLVLLGACVTAGLLTGCTSSRSLVRSLRLSVVDLQRKSADRVLDETTSRSSSEVDEPEEADAALSDVSSVEPNGTEDARHPEDQADERLPDRPTSVAKHRVAKDPRSTRDLGRSHRQRSRPPVEEPDDFLNVLLTGFEDDAGEPLPDEPPPPADDEHKPKASTRFQVPPELPGSDAPGLNVPRFDPKQSSEERRAVIETLYDALPELPPATVDDQTQPRWSLPELEQVAWENHPAQMQAAALVEVAHGAMIQAGLHPNPTVGYEADTVNTLGTAGYHGPYMTQQVVTGGKLQLARCAAAMEYENAYIASQQTRIEVATRVRRAYYDLLVSQERRRMLVALAQFTDDIYRGQIDLVTGGQVAPYEPLQLRVFALQARNAAIAAHNGVVAAGRRLGAATGMTEVDTFRIIGQAKDPPTGIDYRSAKAYLWENHTQLRTVRNRIVQSQYLSRLEYIRPRIPDVNFYSTVQKDYTGPPFGTTFNLQVGVPIPVFDRNQGNILATQSSILGHERAYAATQHDLAGRLAEILARFDTARAQAANYREHKLLWDQVRTYRGVYKRYREGGQAPNDNLNLVDVIVTQQTLSSAVIGYADVLDQLWQAYVDAADLLQIEDLAQLPAWFGQAE